MTAGSGSTTTPLYRIAQSDPLRIFVDVPQSAYGDLMNAGVPVEIHASGGVGGSFSGKIARSSESLDSRPAPCGWKWTCPMPSIFSCPACM